MDNQSVLLRIKDAQDLMAEGFKELRRIAAELSGERGLGSSDFEDYVDDRDLAEDEESHEGLHLAGEIGPVPDTEMLDGYLGRDEDECSDFPGRPFFDPKAVDWDDPAFASGVSLGIPYAVVIRSHDGQDKLLPIKDGRFVDERERT